MFACIYKQAYRVAMELGGLGCGMNPSAGILGGRAPLRTFLGSKEQESPRESTAGIMRISIYENTPKKLVHLPPLKVATT